MRKKVGIVHLSLGGPTRAIEDLRGKVWLFEDHPNFGPIVLKPNEDPATDQPGEGSYFWPAHEAWAKQGKRLDGVSGKHPLCKWEPV